MLGRLLAKSLSLVLMTVALKPVTCHASTGLSSKAAVKAKWRADFANKAVDRIQMDALGDDGLPTGEKARCLRSLLRSDLL